MDTATPPQSARAQQALELVQALQARFAEGLQEVARTFGDARAFERKTWLRDEGRHGGGARLGTALTEVFNRASINVSCVHYDDEPGKRLRSATALSTIIHPRHPRAPSVHMHFSLTELRSGQASWRLMADLNPAIPNAAQTEAFERMLKEAAPAQYAEGKAQGERYFFIPTRKRHRGVAHFYLEGYDTGDFNADRAFVQKVAQAAIDHYTQTLREALAQAGPVSAADEEAQLAYHTLYLLQVLTLDRGTTSGLLIHDQNDVGTLGSLPSFVDRGLLASWIAEQPAPQDALLRAITQVLPEAHPAEVTTQVRAKLAQTLREHYRAHPEALALQASGDVVPPTVANHLA